MDFSFSSQLWHIIHIFNALLLAASGVSQTVQALKGQEGDVLLRGVKEKSTIKEVKHILEMVTPCFLSLHSRLPQSSLENLGN